MMTALACLCLWMALDSFTEGESKRDWIVPLCMAVFYGLCAVGVGMVADATHILDTLVAEE